MCNTSGKSATGVQFGVATTGFAFDKPKAPTFGGARLRSASGITKQVERDAPTIGSPARGLYIK